MDRNAYLEAVREIISKHKNIQDLSYFNGHLPRFHAQLDMFDQCLATENIRFVRDLGTDIPYVSFYFHLKNNADIYLGCIDTPDRINLCDGVLRTKINLNEPPPLKPQADLVICTECLEHLPANLFMVRQALCEYVAPGKFLLLSFPLNGMNAKDYGLDLPHIDHNGSHQHIREFTEQTAREFYLGTGFDLIAERITWTDAYGGNIMNVLLKKRG